jgi:hypothetical protein
MPARAILVAGISFALASPVEAADWRRETDQKTIAGRAENFEAELQGLGFAGKVVSCSHVVREAEGSVGNSWGAICAVKTNKKTFNIQVCDDDGIGYFALQSGTYVVTDGDTAQFMEHNCTGV